MDQQAPPSPTFSVISIPSPPSDDDHWELISDSEAPGAPSGEYPDSARATHRELRPLLPESTESFAEVKLEEAFKLTKATKATETPLEFTEPGDFVEPITHEDDDPELVETSSVAVLAPPVDAAKSSASPASALSPVPSALILSEFTDLGPKSPPPYPGPSTGASVLDHPKARHDVEEYDFCNRGSYAAAASAAYATAACLETCPPPPRRTPSASPETAGPPPPPPPTFGPPPLRSSSCSNSLDRSRSFQDSGVGGLDHRRPSDDHELMRPWERAYSSNPRWLFGSPLDHIGPVRVTFTQTAHCHGAPDRTDNRMCTTPSTVCSRRRDQLNGRQHEPDPLTWFEDHLACPIVSDEEQLPCRDSCIPMSVALAVGDNVRLPAFVQSRVTHDLRPILEEMWSDSLRTALACDEDDSVLATVLLRDEAWTSIGPRLDMERVRETLSAMLGALRAEAADDQGC
ncbi:hypothetical protein CC85DRAFT_144840 [Cutaneotrichosporon oleaginosum]|uniref:Uncharacterized protein n=1 Tax=Cutaneotrichosporon oleaginosum TaxID=879819 RepID=A0A0J0XHZ9_9TREE|nr:uncharacterized protein CC85DRAFT_144840 [Cutaneotrichosporon oleaginosum]KLT40637.1 hypothetical protein CC85DRAFT_144840 [Cutaneotrichosporon oleaginosum]TXT12447.1 hypothetical protein COLE_02857 [Cutaneotrichosporon oleaginosum]